MTMPFIRDGSRPMPLKSSSISFKPMPAQSIKIPDSAVQIAVQLPLLLLLRTHTFKYGTSFLSLSGSLADEPCVTLLLVVKNILKPVLFSGSAVQGIKDLKLHVRRQSPALDGAADHLVRDLFCRGGYNIMRAQRMPLHDPRDRLLSEIIYDLP